MRMTRSTAAKLPRWRKTLTRKRARPGMAYEKSHAPCSLSVRSACSLMPMRSRATRAVSSARSTVELRDLDSRQLPVLFDLWGARGREDEIADPAPGFQHCRDHGRRAKRAQGTRRRAEDHIRLPGRERERVRNTLSMGACSEVSAKPARLVTGAELMSARGLFPPGKGAEHDGRECDMIRFRAFLGPVAPPASAG